VIVTELTPAPDPVRCCELLEGLSYRIFLDSALKGTLGTSLARYSFLTADPVAVVRSKGAATERLDLLNGSAHAVAGDALAAVQSTIAPYRTEPAPGLPPFQGGAAGYLAYDWANQLERLPTPRFDDLAMPDVVMGIYDWVIAWDHDQSRAWLISTGLPETSATARERRASERAAAVRERLADIEGGPKRAALRSGPDVARPFVARPFQGRDRETASSYPVDAQWSDPRVGLRSSFTHDGYLNAVNRVREYILAGDIFQTNLSQRFEAPLVEPPWDLYRRLRTQNAAPFAAYLDFAEALILSASPERFLRVDPDGRVETRPIKGTRPRGVGPEHDAALGRALTESAKDRSENLMIVDLIRNDLSRVCSPGTVRVKELFALERFATVHHLVSTVVGELRPGTGALDLLRAAFPGGSITGAPKLRAMEIIAELEPSARGVYCGAIGYLSLSGALDTSIPIRTAVVRDGRVYLSAGGGIVADSDAEQEYRETLDKARGMIDALIASA
jgi:para-aminobenzoate synthetase component 1